MQIYEKYEEMKFLVEKIQNIDFIVENLNEAYENLDEFTILSIKKKQKPSYMYLDFELSKHLLAFFLNEKNSLEKELSNFL